MSKESNDLRQMRVRHLENKERDLDKELARIQEEKRTVQRELAQAKRPLPANACLMCFNKGDEVQMNPVSSDTDADKFRCPKCGYDETRDENPMRRGR